MNALQKSLVFLVRSGMRQQKLNQKKLADLAGCSENHLSDLLLGKRQGTLEIWDTLLYVTKVPIFQQD